MSTSPTHGPAAPAPTATVISYAQRITRKGLVLGGIFMAMGVLFVVLAVIITAGLNGNDPQPVGLVALLFATIGYSGLKLFRSALALRPQSVSIDDTGLWLRNSAGQNVIRWDNLAGVAVHWSENDRNVRQYSIELCPSGPIDRDDPVLWGLVRDDEPLTPGLPRLRYRFVTSGEYARYRGPLVEAIRNYAPHLWLGETQREPGHCGSPDYDGHRERTAGTVR
ncbi:hypothetical protein EJ357_22555 [Streptomyces cyaneochromogenes]|uniref:PH domain-containing protein n=1 Tax=Streptomyces cyaneochromogenes TaxID=2496836 RepID=A0A3Q9ETN5_9ACTN|nr:hypothetical protein [Streptomyces cyaneochromogenes]AZQ35917.1 hypothetical protein EJ357_22555 [Streptomyces cyaneochromogenes]